MKIFREPVLHFLLLGLALLAVDHFRRGRRDEGAPIIVSPELVEGLRQEHQRRTGKQPDAKETQALVDAFLDEEVLFREAVRLQLDKGDALVRRRMVQKIELLAGDAAEVATVSEEEARAYLAAHPNLVVQPERFTFRHLFFSRDRRGAAAASDAEKALRELVPSTAAAKSPPRGDAFAMGDRLVGRTAQEVEAALGKELLSVLSRAAPGVWTGPVASPYGFHDLLLEARIAGGLPPLSQVRPRIEIAIRRERAEKAREAFVRQLRTRYRIETTK